MYIKILKKDLEYNSTMSHGEFQKLKDELYLQYKHNEELK